MKQEQKPVNKISLFDLLILLEITKPYKKEPIRETRKLLFKKNLKKVAKNPTNSSNVKNFFFNF